MSQGTIEVLNPSASQARLWQLAQFLGIVATLGLVAGLIALPETSLHILWDVTIPILPAVFLINPAIWRNVCPLATLNKLTGDRWGKRALPSEWIAATTVIGVALLYILVPARRFLFNTNGAALAVTIVAVALLSLILGFFFEAKAGFCNAVCPVLNVERLYGQRPLASVANARCSPCTLCTKKGCVDLRPEKSVAQTIGPKRRTRGWITSPFGVFAGTFPGFVYAYFSAVDGSLDSAPAVYGHFLQWCAVSYAVVLLLTFVRPNHNEKIVLLLGALSIGLYYWFAAPTFLEAVALPAGTVLPFRAVALVLVAFWLRRAYKTA